MQAQSGIRQVLSQAGESVVEVGTVGADVIAQNLLMKLRAPGKQRGHHRGPDAAADIAHEIDQAGNRIILLRGYVDVRRQVNGHEQEAQESHLEHAQPHRGIKTNLQINLLRGVEHGQGQGQPAKGNEVARLEFGGKYAHHGHHEQQSEPARRDRKPGKLRRVSQEGLQKKRHHDQAAEIQDSQGEHHQVGTREVEILEQPNVNDGGLLKPLPEHQGNQADRGNDDERGDEARAEPVILLAPVQKNLQRADAQGQQGDADVVQLDPGALQPDQIGRVVDQAIYQKQGQQAHRKIDEKDPPPGIIEGDPSA